MSNPTLELPPGDPRKPGNTKGSGSGNPAEPNQTLLMPQGSTGGIGMPGPSGQDEAALANALKTLPNYEIDKKLGEGGMGSVYRARQRTLNRTVAIKVLPQRLSTDARYSARLLREAQVLAKINHANVIACYDVGEHQGLLYVVMEFVEGESLYQLILRRNQLPVEEALSYLKQSVLGLDHANAVGVIHRDIKPENLLVSVTRPQGTTIRANAFGTLKIADLGLAAYTDDTQQNTRLTVEGSALGSPYYMSPEQTLGEKNLDIRTDMYALGITLYHALTGKTPHEGQSIGAILAKKLSEVIPDPREIKPDLPPAVSLLIQKMTARKKEDRYASYGELLRDIEALEQQQPLVAKPLPADRISVALSPDSLKQLGRTVPRGGGGTAATGNNKTLLFVIGGAALGLLALGMLLSKNQKGSTSSPAAVTPAPMPAAAPAVPAQPALPSAEPPKAAAFEPRNLIDNKSTQGWAASGDGHIFSFEAEDDALTLQAPMGKGWAQAERELPGAEYKLQSSLKVVQGADDCELQLGLGGKEYLALGIRFPKDAKKLAAYLEVRDAATHKLVKALNNEVSFDPDAWTDLRLNVWEGQAVCFVNNKPFGSAELAAGPGPRSVRLGVNGGIGLFRNLWALPRPAPEGKTP